MAGEYNLARRGRFLPFLGVTSVPVSFCTELSTMNDTNLLSSPERQSQAPVAESIKGRSRLQDREEPDDLSKSSIGHIRS